MKGRTGKKKNDFEVTKEVKLTPKKNSLRGSGN
jgi:hypothetical protein